MYQPKGVAVSSASNVLFPFGSPNTIGVGALWFLCIFGIQLVLAVGLALMLSCTFVHFRDAGYVTATIGKHHMQYDPVYHGFDHVVVEVEPGGG